MLCIFLMDNLKLQTHSNVFVSVIIIVAKHNLEPKMPYLGIFGSEFEKSYFQIRNRRPYIFLKAQFHEKVKTLKSWTKKYLVWVSFAGI